MKNLLYEFKGFIIGFIVGMLSVKYVVGLFNMIIKRDNEQSESMIYTEDTTKKKSEIVDFGFHI